MAIQTTVVLGASGAMGARLTERLKQSGHHVVEASRSNGIDVLTGHGLAECFAGADNVVDCLNITTQNRRKATNFFTTTARHVAEAAAQSSVKRIYVVSIVNAARPAVAGSLGYYGAKAQQEVVYRCGTVPVTRLRTTQWFELAQTLIDQLGFGPIAAIPRMRVQPVAADSAADLLARAIATGRSEDVSVAGPQVHDMVDLARRIASQAGGPRILGLRVGGKAVRTDGLVPDQGAPDLKIDSVTFDEWLART